MITTPDKLKTKLRDDIERQTSDYLRNGGKIVVGTKTKKCRPVGKVSTSMDIRSGNA